VHTKFTFVLQLLGISPLRPLGSTPLLDYFRSPCETPPLQNSWYASVQMVRKKLLLCEQRQIVICLFICAGLGAEKEATASPTQTNTNQKPRFILKYAVISYFLEKKKSNSQSDK